MQTAERPNAHWGTFTKEHHSLAACLSIVDGAMQRKGYEIFEKGSHVWIGGNRAVIVQVTCVPIGNNNTSITVSAFSSDGRTAELARNEVREDIANTVRIDP